jgi:hypothetical protein
VLHEPVLRVELGLGQHVRLVRVATCPQPGVEDPRQRAAVLAAGQAARHVYAPIL